MSTEVDVKPRSKARVVLAGSARKSVAGTKGKDTVDPAEQIQVTLRLRPRPGAARTVKDLMKLGAQLPGNRKYVSRETFAAKRGADPDDVARVDAFAHDHALTVIRTNLAHRTVRLSGSVADFDRAFGVKLQTFRAAGRSYRGRTGSIFIPKSLEGIVVGVDGGLNFPGPDEDADGEVTLDIEVAGSVAPGARIAVYFAPNTTSGFINAVNFAVHDDVRKPSVVSISWGGPEDPKGEVSEQFLQGLDQAFQDAAALGVTICCASGDDGSADMGSDWDGKPHCDFPSSSPFALACGGTKLEGSGSDIESEVVWNEGRRGGAGGGGVSNVFSQPSYQAKARVPRSPTHKRGRGVPDLSGNADPETGYEVLVAGKAFPIGGTSAVAPLLAGLVALMNERLLAKAGNPCGFINPLLYGAAQKAEAIRDVTAGNNDIDGSLKGKYSARQGWDACSGLGVPDGTKLLEVLGG
jgi:subtilase family serine protease